MVRKWSAELSPGISADLSFKNTSPLRATTASENWNCCLKFCSEHGAKGLNPIEECHITPDTKRGEWPMHKGYQRGESMIYLFRKQMASLEWWWPVFIIYGREKHTNHQRRRTNRKWRFAISAREDIGSSYAYTLNCNSLLKQDLKKKKTRL